MKTSTPKPPAPEWILFDANGQVIGRLASRIAKILSGKHRKDFSPHRIYGDHVVVINAKNVAVHPAKLAQKVYQRHTGYPGHIRTEPLSRLIRDDPAGVVERAVKGMLPKNRLRPGMLKRLHIFVGENHPHEAQKPVRMTFSS